MRIPVSLVLVFLAGASIGSYAQTYPAYSGCEVPEVRAAFDTTLSQDSLAKLKTKERRALQQKVIGELLAKFPRDYKLNLEEANLSVDSLQEENYKVADEARREQLVKNAREHPDDAVALLLAGKFLVGKDTPEAIRLMEAAKAKAPEFPWPAHELSEVYWQGKLADEAKMKENMERFYSLCPAWTASDYFGNQLENFRLQKDLPLVAKTAVALRAKLEEETDAKRLLDYQTLWQREFLTRPPSDHDAEREQIKKDLKRLETLVSNGDEVWRSFLIGGYQQSGASNEEVARLKDAAARDFPHAGPGYSKLWEQFSKEHPRPDGQKNTEAWKAYDAAEIELMKKLVHDFPDLIFVQRSEYFQVVREDPYISEEDGLAALDRYLKAMEEYGGFGTLSFMPSDPPKFLLDHGWQPERALELLKKTSTYKDGGHTKTSWNDNISADDLKRFKWFGAQDDRATLGLILKAVALVHKPEEALAFRAAIEEPVPDDKRVLEQYWTNRARFAALDKHPQDALVYYHLALESRSKAPEYYQGILRDDLMTEFHEFWTAQGGTEAAWTAWNPPAVAGKPEPVPAKSQNAAAKEDKEKVGATKQQESDWKPITKQMPLFELSDFAGKTWRQKDLQGKVVVVVSWATWCGPCRMQDKLLEKFYDKVRDRKDLVILSFNVDENPGNVLPFMRQQNYTFPVLAAFSYEDAKGLVPRTWIIDPKGNWRWVKDGYDDAKSYAEFEKQMLDQIHTAQAGQ